MELRYWSNLIRILSVSYFIAKTVEYSFYGSIQTTLSFKVKIDHELLGQEKPSVKADRKLEGQDKPLVKTDYELQG